ncbi:MAG: hypothetical protein KAW17_10210 [Candidatus Eisenbacteria sp.]|nr:hypothetical protein [Candidatus Eisenbacteria bacterium]
MRNLIAVVLILFGITTIISGSVELYTSGEDGGLMARLFYILGGIAGAGLTLAGAALTRNLPWAKLLAGANLIVVAVLSILSAVQQYGQPTATHHAMRALLALALLLALARKKET